MASKQLLYAGAVLLAASLACDLTPDDDSDASRSLLGQTDSGQGQGQGHDQPPRPMPGLAPRIAMTADHEGLLDDDQFEDARAVMADLADAAAPMREAHHDLMTAVADGIDGCALQTDAVDLAIASLVSAAGAAADADAYAVTELHAILDTEQRADVVAAMAEQDGPPPPPPLGPLLQHIGVDDDTQAAIESALAEDAPPAPDTAALDEVLQAFVSDTFDAESLGLGDHAEARASDQASRTVASLTTVCELLDADQRAALAEALLAGPPEGGQCHDGGQPPPEGGQPPSDGGQPPHP